MDREKTYELVVFDCDGTLVDSETMNNLVTCELLAQQGLPQYDLDYAFEHFVGIKFTTILQDISAQTGHIFPADMRDRYVARARELMPQHLKPVAGARAMVQAASAQAAVAVASNGQRDNVIASLERTGLLDCFDQRHIFTFTDVPNAKPAPDMFLLAAQRAGVSPAQSLVVEDSVTGVRAGVAAGMTVYGFTALHQNPERYGEKLKNAGAVSVYSSFIHMRDDLYG